jgi:hypothetical protein
MKERCADNVGVGDAVNQLTCADAREPKLLILDAVREGISRCIPSRSIWRSGGVTAHPARGPAFAESQSSLAGLAESYTREVCGP